MFRKLIKLIKCKIIWKIIKQQKILKKKFYFVFIVLHCWPKLGLSKFMLIFSFPWKTLLFVEWGRGFAPIGALGARSRELKVIQSEIRTAPGPLLNP